MLCLFPLWRGNQQIYIITSVEITPTFTKGQDINLSLFPSPSTLLLYTYVLRIYISPCSNPRTKSSSSFPHTHKELFLFPPINTMADTKVQTPPVVEGVDKKVKPEKPNEEEYQAALKKAEKEHADSMARFVRISFIHFQFQGRMSTKCFHRIYTYITIQLANTHTIECHPRKT